MSKNSIDFKLLAIKPLGNCSQKYCNNLQHDTLYKFYQYYEFKPENGIITEIEKSGSDFDIYDDYIPEDRDLKINVSAIVGKNGSGKSSLVELLYLCAYLVASANGLLAVEKDSHMEQRHAKELEEIKAGLKLEVYYKFDDKYNCIVIDADYNNRRRPKSKIRFFDLLSGDKVPLDEFFYTIAINYSLYGLNESIIGAWIGKLFHKNDGYQTPIVINPFRDRGSINIDGEMHFAQTRLLSNIRMEQGTRNEIVSGKGIKEIIFVINRAKVTPPEGHSSNQVFEELRNQTGRKKNEIFALIYTAILGEAPKSDMMGKKEWEKMTIEYVITKIIRIAKNYPEYGKFYTENTEKNISSLKHIDAYLEELKKDLTHVTLKLRQALNFFRNDPLRLDDNRIRHIDNRIIIQADLFAERYEQNKNKYPDRDPMEFIPIAPFSPKIILEDGKNFHRLSSGEQQFIHSIQGVLYHILNLDSVFKQNRHHAKATYQSINIIFDEIELYFHPEYQRKFVSEILQQISKLYAPKIASINILFLTHSPFILSDIPGGNILCLEDGYVRKGQQLTFAANIHQMLASSFFMKSTTGDFSKYQYEQIIRFYQTVLSFADKHPDALLSSSQLEKLQRRENVDFNALRREYLRQREKFLFVTNQIGEQVISGALKNHLAFIDTKLSVGAQDDLMARKKRLEDQLNEVNRELKKRQ